MGQLAIEPEDGQRELRVAELLSSMSRALDLTEGQPQGHCIRCCWIGMQVGRKIALNDRQLSDLYYTLLLKDLGCSSNAARICQLYLADDLTFKHDFKHVNGSLPQVLHFVLTHTGPEAGLAERFRAVVNILQNGGEIAREQIETRCQTGAGIARKLGFPESVATPIRQLDEHWDGSGLPERIGGDDISILSQLALMAQVIDVFHSSAGPQAAIDEVKQRSGTWFAPYLTHVFAMFANDDAFWETLRSERLSDAIYDLEPARMIKLADEDYLDDIASAFAQVIDAKSPFTSGHSQRVTLFTDLIGSRIGLDERHRRTLRRAALLHDIGKLGVSNRILDKRSWLDADEWEAVKMHPVHGEAILSGISAFADLKPVVAGHHERLDGTGYPYGLQGDEIDLDTRIVTTADIFDALTADRPYRAAMPVDEALAIMDEKAGPAIDPQCLVALKAALDDRPGGAGPEPAAAGPSG